MKKYVIQFYDDAWHWLPDKDEFFDSLEELKNRIRQLDPLGKWEWGLNCGPEDFSK